MTIVHGLASTHMKIFFDMQVFMIMHSPFDERYRPTITVKQSFKNQHLLFGNRLRPNIYNSVSILDSKFTHQQILKKKHLDTGKY